MASPETSISLGLATAAVVWGVFSAHQPSVSDVRASNPSPAVESSRRAAVAEAAGIVAGISLIAKDPTIFIIGGSMVAVLGWTYAAAHHTDPQTNKIVSAQSVKVDTSATANSDS